jgi:hypothetical protein
VCRAQAVKDGPSWAVDAWGLGCLIQEVFSGRPLARTEDLRNTGARQGGEGEAGGAEVAMGACSGWGWVGGWVRSAAVRRCLQDLQGMRVPAALRWLLGTCGASSGAHGRPELSAS